MFDKKLVFQYSCYRLNFPTVFWALACTAGYRRRCDITPQHVGTSTSKYYSQAVVGKLSFRIITQCSSVMDKEHPLIEVRVSVIC